MTHPSRQGFDAAFRAVVAVCGVLSLAVLGGIFVVLLGHTVVAFTMGDPVGALTPDERAVLSEADVAALAALDLRGPTVVGFLADTLWAPGATGAPRYGVLPMLVSTVLTTVTAMALAVPVGLATAAWLAFRAAPRTRRVVKFAVEMLAALPSVVVGFVGTLLTRYAHFGEGEHEEDRERMAGLFRGVDWAR